MALATKDAKGHPGSDTAKAKAEATQTASSVKAKAKGSESKTTSQAKADGKKAKDKAEQGAKKTKADADKEATKAKKKAKDDSAKAKKKAKDDAKKAQAKKKKDGDAKAKKPKNPKSPIKLKDKSKDSKRPKKDRDIRDDQDTKKSKKVKADVRSYLSENLPKRFRDGTEIVNILTRAYGKFRPSGLKALRVNRKGEKFTIQAKASPYENVGLTQDDILFNLDDIELMTRKRGVSLKAKIGDAVIESTNTPGKKGELPKHAEENFVLDAEKELIQLPNEGKGQKVIVQLSSSPCGDPGCDAKLQEKLHDCASTLINFSQRNGIDLTVQIVGLYTPQITGAKAASRDGIKRMLEAGIRVETWSPDTVIHQIESKYGKLDKTAENALRSKLRNAARAINLVSGINLGG